MERKLVNKVRNRTAQLTVIGLGHIGLVTAVTFAKSGLRVVGLDVKPEIVKAVSSGKSHIREQKLAELAKEVVKKGLLRATTNEEEALRNCDVSIVCVQTPLTGGNIPDLSHLKGACGTIGRNLSHGRLVVIESTIPPKTTLKVIAPLLEDVSGLKCGKDFWLAHCPESALVGNALKEFTENIRVIGGYDAKSTEIAAELFKTVTSGQILSTDSTTAEVTKLAENSFRDVNIAFANELALICEKIGVDVMDVVQLANTHPRVKIHRPGCGVGGPCLPKDPYLLLHGVEDRGQKLKLMLFSRELNEYMPEHTISLATDALKKIGKDIKSSKVTVLGVAYKGETSDARNSPAEGIIHKLIKLAARTVVYDPYVWESFGAVKAADIRDALQGADCVVIVTDHKEIRKLQLKELKKLMNPKPVIVDGRRLLSPAAARKRGFTYVAVGYSD